MEILIGLIVMGLLARKAIDLTHPKQTRVRMEPIAHQPTTAREEAHIALLRERYEQLAALHAQIHHEYGDSVTRTLTGIRRDMRKYERELTLRGRATPVCH